MNRTSPLVIECERINEIKFKPACHVQGLNEVMRKLFPNAFFWPRTLEWTIRVHDEAFAETVTILDEVLSFYYAENYPEIRITVHEPRTLIVAAVPDAPKPDATPMTWHARYKVPDGDFCGSIAV